MLHKYKVKKESGPALRLVVIKRINFGREMMCKLESMRPMGRIPML